MECHGDTRLDLCRAGRSLSTRRAILRPARVGRGLGAELAEPFAIEPARDLEAPQGAGARRPDLARPRRAATASRLEAPPLAEATAWLEGYRRFWEDTFQHLDGLLDELKTDDGRRRAAMTNTETLQVTTPTEREIVMTRVFDAPRSLVFDAWTKPELLKRWLGVRNGWSFEVCEVDLKVGGAYRFVWRGRTEPRWGWAASTARSWRPSGSSRPRSSTTPGTRAKRWTRSSSSRGRQDDRSRRRCSTRRRRSATPS